MEAILTLLASEMKQWQLLPDVVVAMLGVEEESRSCSRATQR
jgi:hypothetical protein